MQCCTGPAQVHSTFLRKEPRLLRRPKAFRNKQGTAALRDLRGNVAALGEGRVQENVGEWTNPDEEGTAALGMFLQRVEPRTALSETSQTTRGLAQHDLIEQRRASQALQFWKHQRRRSSVWLRFSTLRAEYGNWVQCVVLLSKVPPFHSFAVCRSPWTLSSS